MKSYKAGAIVLATEQGLGYMAKDFFDNGIIDKVYIHAHSTRKNNRNWYPESAIVDTIDQLIEECDIILGIETFFNWKIIPQAREKGKKTVLIPMYECSNFPLPYFPDLLLCPSALDFDVYTKAYPACEIVYDPHWKQIGEDSQSDYHPSSH